METIVEMKKQNNQRGTGNCPHIHSPDDESLRSLNSFLGCGYMDNSPRRNHQKRTFLRS
jgi:hypothetical protein